MNNTFRQRNALDKTLQNSTSEYGSADPSPTMPFPQVDDTSFTDGDSDTDSAMPAHLIRVCFRSIQKNGLLRAALKNFSTPHPNIWKHCCFQELKHRV